MSQQKAVISVKQEDCVNCHRCISVCPVKFCNDGSGDYVEIDSDLCIGCGLCAEKCPQKNIEMKDGKPVWKAQCYQCLRCINACPRQAIQYGKGTEGRRRYTIWPYRPQEEKA